MFTFLDYLKISEENQLSTIVPLNFERHFMTLDFYGYCLWSVYGAELNDGSQKIGKRRDCGQKRSKRYKGAIACHREDNKRTIHVSQWLRE